MRVSWWVKIMINIIKPLTNWSRMKESSVLSHTRIEMHPLFTTTCSFWSGFDSLLISSRFRQYSIENDFCMSLFVKSLKFIPDQNQLLFLNQWFVVFFKRWIYDFFHQVFFIVDVTDALHKKNVWPVMVLVCGCCRVEIALENIGGVNWGHYIVA